LKAAYNFLWNCGSRWRGIKKIYFSLILIAITFVTISFLFYKKQEGRVVEIVAGNNHNCALLKTGVVKSWGENQYGQLGDRTMQDSSIPVAVRF
jgi:hypothetical protein